MAETGAPNDFYIFDLLCFKTRRLKGEYDRTSRPNYYVFISLKIREGWGKCLSSFHARSRSQLPVQPTFGEVAARAKR